MKSMIVWHIMEGHSFTWDIAYVIKEFGSSRKLDAQRSFAILREPSVCIDFLRGKGRHILKR